MAKINLEISGRDTGAAAALKGVETGMFNAQIAYETFSKAASKIIDIGKQAITEWTKQEKAVKLLQSAVGGSVENFVKYSGVMMNAVGIQDDLILETMKMGSVLGIAKDELQNATQSAIGLSKAFGVDLDTAMRMVVQSTEGNYRMMTRYLPSLRNATNESEKLAIMNGAVAKGMKLAGAEMSTFAGKSNDLQNQLGEVKEEFGKIITQGLTPLIDIVRGVVKWFLSLDEKTRGMIVTFGSLAALVPLISVGIYAMATAFRVLTAAMATNPFGLMMIAITLAVAAVISLVGWLGKTKKSINDLSENQLVEEMKKEKKAFDDNAKATGIYSTKIEVLKSKREELRATMMKEGDIKDYKLKELEAQIAALEKIGEIKKRQKELGTEGAGPGKEKFDEARDLRLSYQQKILEDEGKNAEAILMERDKELEKAKEGSREEYLINKHFNTLILQEKTKLFQTMFGIGQQFYSGLGTMVSGLYQNEIDMAVEGSEKQKELKRKQWEVNKAFVIGSIILSTAQAAVNGFSTVPFLPVGIAMGALALIMGGVQLAVAAGTPMPAFARGGVSQGGFALVGEQGPEVVNLPSGSKVFSNRESKNISGITINIGKVVSNDPEAFISGMRRVARMEAARA